MPFMIRITPLLAIVCLVVPASLVEIPSVAATSSRAIENTQSTSRGDKSQWTWVDKSGRTRTLAELDEILARHKEWLKSMEGRPPLLDDSNALDGSKLIGAYLRDANLRQLSLQDTDLRQSDLEGIDLTHANLQRADLSEANLTNAALNFAQMDDAKLRKSTLTGADCDRAQLNRIDFTEVGLGKVNFSYAKLNSSKFMRVDMRGLNLTYTDLKYADLTEADFRQATLEKTIFSGATLTRALLSNARFLDVALDGADLRGAELEGLTFQANRNLPKASLIAGAKHLEYLTYEDDPEALARLEKEFRETGFREQERKITYALKRREEQ